MKVECQTGTGSRVVSIEPGEKCDLFDAHPLPWRVEYKPLFEWHRHSQPRVVDANGVIVFSPPQHVNHPGEYDTLADQLCKAVVCSVGFV